MRAEPTGFSDRLDIRVKGIGIKDEAIIFALFVLSSWKDKKARMMIIIIVIMAIPTFCAPTAKFCDNSPLYAPVLVKPF